MLPVVMLIALAGQAAHLSSRGIWASEGYGLVY
jgi:hypothetical protein